MLFFGYSIFFGCCGLFHFKLFATIISFFWFFLLKIISCYVIIDYSRLYYHKYFLVILLAAIVGYSINGYWCLLMVILLMAIGSYFIVSYLNLFFIIYY